MLNLLNGVRVIDCTMLNLAPQIGMYLGDLGADVIKVEEPPGGDYARDFLGQVTPRNSPVHLQLNKNKKSVSLNLHSEAGKSALFELVKTADIFLNSYRPSSVKRIGVDYDVLKRIKPDLIYIAGTGFGMTGPYKDVVAHGYQFAALSGGLPAETDQDGHVHRSPNLDDMFGGIGGNGQDLNTAPYYAVMAGLAALERRRRTGEGAFIDVAATDACISASWRGVFYNLNYDQIVDKTGLTPRGKPSEGWVAGATRYGLYETKDGRNMLICAIERKFWQSFCEEVERTDLLETFREGLAVDFGEDKPWLQDELIPIFRTRTAEEWMKVAVENDIPLTTAYRSAEVKDDPHNSFRGTIAEQVHPDAGRLFYARYPAIVDGERSDVAIPAPRFGEHTEEILKSIGLTESQIEAASSA